MQTDINKVLNIDVKINVKNRSVCMVYCKLNFLAVDFSPETFYMFIHFDFFMFLKFEEGKFL